MEIALARVDDRFIHGQILESWIPFLRAQGVIVVNDELASDSFQKSIMSLAIPDRISLKIVSVDDALDLINDDDLNNKTLLLIVSSIRDAYRLFSDGVKFSRLNIGNIGQATGAQQLSYSVWVENEDLELLKTLIAEGVNINLQSVPRERDIDMRSVLGMIAI